MDISHQTWLCSMLICLQDLSSSKHELIRQQYCCICGNSGSVGFVQEWWVFLKILKTFGELAVIFLHIKYLFKNILTRLERSWSLLSFNWVYKKKNKSSDLSKLLKCWQDENIRIRSSFWQGAIFLFCILLHSCMSPLLLLAFNKRQLSYKPYSGHRANL